MSKETLASKPEGKEDFVYVTIPERDMYDNDHPGLWNNHNYFGPGVHLVEPHLAGALTDRLLAFERASMRILQPKRDLKALRDVAATPRFPSETQ